MNFKLFHVISLSHVASSVSFLRYTAITMTTTCPSKIWRQALATVIAVYRRKETLLVNAKFLFAINHSIFKVFKNSKWIRIQICKLYLVGQAQVQ
jgi:hypothetical protein